MQTYFQSYVHLLINVTVMWWLLTQGHLFCVHTIWIKGRYCNDNSIISYCLCWTKGICTENKYHTSCCIYVLKCQTEVSALLKNWVYLLIDSLMV